MYFDKLLYCLYCKCICKKKRFIKNILISFFCFIISYYCNIYVFKKIKIFGM